MTSSTSFSRSPSRRRWPAAGLLTLAGIVAATAFTTVGVEPSTSDDSTGAARSVHPDQPHHGDITRIPASRQMTGDPDAGLEYILHGGYVGAGYPIDLYRMLNANKPVSVPTIEREGVDPWVPYEFNRFHTRAGVEVIGGFNCFGCHASELRGELMLGLGHAMSDFSSADPIPVNLLRGLAAQKYGEGSAEYRIFNQFIRGVEVLYPGLVTPFRGVNAAFRLEELAAAHRRPHDLSWSSDALFEPMATHIASDVPPWWHMKKKHALYYNGMGRGDFTKLISQINVVAIEDVEDAKATVNRMDDVLAYMMSIEPPSYPSDIDAALAARGETVFEANCSTCHGTYGVVETYPNKLVPVDVVGTDPHYAAMFLESALPRWYNRSWYATSEPQSRVEPSMAYIAPPLDGIWATAPYFHNGSVPMLDMVIDSSKRPTFWRRPFDSTAYDLERIGWTHDEVIGPRDETVYDTTMTGYGNMGHTFGDDLSEEDRLALLEYLKTL